MGSFKALTTLLFYIENSRQLSLLELFFLLHPCFIWRFHTYQNCVFLLGLLKLVYRHSATWPIWALTANASLPPHLAFKPPTLLLPTLYILLLHSPHPLIFLAVFLYFLLPLYPLTRTGFFNETLEVFKPAALNTLSRLILWILSAFRNPTLDSFSSFRIPVFSVRRSDCIYSRSGILSPDDLTLAAALSSLSGRAYPSLSFLPPCSLS